MLMKKMRPWKAAATALTGITLLAALAGCGGGSTTASTSKSSSSTGKTGSGAASIDKTKTVIALNSSPDVAELPMLIAIQDMKKQGYNISYKAYNGQTVADDAVLSGNAQIGDEATASTVKSVLSGNPIVMFLNKDTNEFALVAQTKYKTIKDLNGVKVGDESPVSSIHSLLLWTQKQYGIKINDVYMPNSPVRAKALLAGQFGATVLEIDDMNKILHEAPTKYHTLVEYWTALPWLLAPNFEATKSFIQAHPTIIQAFTDELMKVTQQIYANPSAYVSVAKGFLPQYTTSVLSATISLSVKDHIWGLANQLESVTKSDAQKTLQFYQQNGVLTAAQAQKLSNLNWIDPTFSQKALASLGISSSSGSAPASSSN